jgi:PST family polysaccharide transporter
MALLPSLLFRGLSSPMLASLRRDMDFRSIAIRTLFGVIAGGMVAIFMARHGFGFWALVVQQWSNEVVGFLVLLRASPIKPWNLRWSRKAMRELLPVALPVMGTAFLSVASRRLDTLALGLFQSNSTVGIYYMANRLVFAAQMVTQHGLSEVAMVVLSSMNRDAARYRRGLLRALRLMSYLCASAFGLLAVAGPWLAPIVFGAAWGPAAQPLRVLAALSVGGAVVSIAGVTLVASGYAAAYSRLATGAAFAQLAAVVLAARWGLMAVVWAVGIVQCAAMLPALRMLTQHYKLTAKSLFGELAPILGLFAIGLATAHWVTSLTSGWFAQPSGSIAFILLMGTGAFPLLRKERRERAEREREALLTN